MSSLYESLNHEEQMLEYDRLNDLIWDAREVVAELEFFRAALMNVMKEQAHPAIPETRQSTENNEPTTQQPS